MIFLIRLTSDTITELMSISKKGEGDGHLNWNNRFQSTLDKIRKGPSSHNIDELISLSRDFNHAAKM